MTHKKESSVGKAYGFFYCDASKQEIERRLPRIRFNASTPSDLELSLIEGVDNLRGDSKLMALAQEAKQRGNNFVFEATYIGNTNRKTASELGDILNQVYQSPLYEANAPFKGATVYEEKGDYLFRD